jgi:molecular chaperone DnaJ
MNLEKNYYDILEVDNKATNKEITLSYRKLAKKYHPDKGGDENKFKDLVEAYEIIGNDEMRQKYDVQSPHGKSYNPNNINNMFRFTFGGDGFNPFGSGFGPFNPFDDLFFRDIFNRKEEFPENLDIQNPINVTLKDVYNNTNIPLKFSHNVKCDNCNFTGFDPNGESFECDACDGKGGDGFTKCKYCNGTGKITTGTCGKCNGEKVIPKAEELSFMNTYSIDNSFVKYMRGMGHQSKHYANKVGTLVIQINYIHDPLYVKEGHNLIYLLNLHYQKAIDGYDFEYEHLDGKKYSLKIPPKTKDGDLLRVKGKGLLKNPHQRGDLIVKINIIVDYNLLDRQN